MLKRKPQNGQVFSSSRKKTTVISAETFLLSCPRILKQGSISSIFSDFFLIFSDLSPNFSEISPISSVGNKIPSDVFKIAWEEK